MAYQKLNTVDYFPHKVIHGRKMFIIRTKFGNDGYTVWFMLLEELAKAHNHIIDLNDKTQLLYLSAEMKVSESKLIEIIEVLVELDEIDKPLWEGNYIYCKKFIENIKDAYKRRKNDLKTYDEICKQYLKKCIQNSKKENIIPHTIVKDNKENNSSKSHSGKIPGKEKKEVTKFWKIYVNDWFVFYKKQFGANPTFKPADAKHLKFIVNQLEKISVSPEKPWTQEYALKVYHHFLNKAISDSWLKSNFLLTNLSTKFDSIVNNPNKKALKPMNQSVMEKMKQYD